MRYVTVILAVSAVMAMAGTARSNTVLDLDDFFYQNDPGGSGYHEGGFDAAWDGSTGTWTFDGSQPNGVTTGGYSYFDIFYLPGATINWNAVTGIKFDVRATTSGTPTSDRDYARLYVRLDNGGPDASLFDDADRVWQANNLDTTKGGGWSTFTLDFDNVTHNSTYVDNDTYNLEDNNRPNSGTIPRNYVESLRFSTFLENNRWIGPDEQMKIEFQNVELTGGAPVVPLPAAAWMALPLLGGLGVMKLRRTRRAASVSRKITQRSAALMAGQ